MRYILQLFLIWCLAAFDAQAQTASAPKANNSLEAQAEVFIKQKLMHPENFRVTVESFEKSMRGASCAAPEFFIPGQVPVLRGPVRIGLRCGDTPKTSFYSMAHILEAQTVYQLKSDVPVGHVLTAEDFVTVKSFPAIAASSTGELASVLIGRQLLVALPAGSVVQRNQTQVNWIIKGGQNVTLYSENENFRISIIGQAMGNAAVGQVIYIRTESGKILSGKVQADGTAVVSH